MKKAYKSRYRWVNNGEDQGLPVHKLVAERALGKPLPKGAEVHHVDENGHNNAPSNLVICPSIAYHKLLHRRMKARDACGNPNWLPCVFCKKHDDPKNLHLYIPRDQTSPRANHSSCATEYIRKRKERRVA